MKCNCICGNEIEVVEAEDRIYMPWIDFDGKCSNCNVYVNFKKFKGKRNDISNIPTS